MGVGLRNPRGQVGPAGLDQLCALLTGKIQTTAHLAEAISQTIAAAGDRLGPVLPRAEDDVNELPDTLVSLDR